MVICQIKEGHGWKELLLQIRGDTGWNVTTFTRFEWGTFVLPDVIFSFALSSGENNQR